MTPVLQTRFGTEGNCWAACLATLFDIPIESVDQCACTNPNWWEETDKFLRSRGLFSIEIEIKKTEDGRRVYPFVFPTKPTVCCLLGPRVVDGKVNEFNHIVVGKTWANAEGYPEFELVHDPLGELRTPLDHIKFIIFFGKVFSHD